MKSQVLSKLLEPTAEEIEATLTEAASMGLGRSDVGKFFSETDRLPSRAEMGFLAKKYPVSEAIHLAASGAVLQDGPPPSFVHVKRNMWKPDTRGASPVVAYATLEVQHGKTTRILDLRVHDGDDSRFAQRDADGQIVKLDLDGGFFQSSMTIVRSPTFEAAHVMPDNVAEATWPNRKDGEGFKHFETYPDQRAMWFVQTILRPLHEEWIGKHVDDLASFRVDAPAATLMPEPTDEQKLIAENAALRAENSSFEERLRALEARR